MARKKKEPSVVEPITRGVTTVESVEVPSFNGRYPDVVRLDPLLSSDPPVRQPVLVQTGIDIITRNPVMKPAPPDPEEQWKTPDRKPYLVKEHITGSYNTVFRTLNQGKVVYLSENEYGIFKPYVTEAPNE